MGQESLQGVEMSKAREKIEDIIDDYYRQSKSPSHSRLALKIFKAISSGEIPGLGVCEGCKKKCHE